MADYPFTTLYPNLGVVRVDAGRSFVMADIPGIIAGASVGTGLGLRFLKHLSRTRLLLHLVDVAPLDLRDPIEGIHIILEELKAYSPALAEQEQWLVLNKLDMLPEEEREAKVQEIVSAVDWKGPVFSISGLQRQGTEALCYALMARLDELPKPYPMPTEQEQAADHHQPEVDTEDLEEDDFDIED